MLVFASLGDFTLMRYTFVLCCTVSFDKPIPYASAVIRSSSQAHAQPLNSGSLL